MIQDSQNGENTPNQIEDLSTGFYYFNFNIVKGKDEEGNTTHFYKQIRLSYPIEIDEINKILQENGYDEISEIR